MGNNNFITDRDFPETETGFVLQGGDLEIDILLDIVKETNSSVIFDVGKGGSAVSPLLTSEGVLYLGACDGIIYAIDVETGRERWRYATQGPILAGLAASHGLVLGASYDGNVYAFDRDGNLSWKFHEGSKITATPVVYRERVYFGSESGTFHCLDMEGRPVWKFSAKGKIGFDACGLDNAVYFGSFDHCVYSLDLDGRLRWKFAVTDIVGGVFPDNDRVYFGSFDKNVYAVDVNGRLLWKVSLPHTQSIGSVITPRDGDVYFGSRGKNFYSFTRDGRKRWTFSTDQITISNTEFDGSGRAYFASGDGNLYCVDSQTGSNIWRFGANSPLGYIAKSGNILMTSAYDGNIFAVDTDGREVWRFHTSLDYPAPVTIQKEVMHTVIAPSEGFEAEKESQGSDDTKLGDYGDLKGNYIQGGDLRDYTGHSLDDSVGGMRYKAGKRKYG